MRKLIVEKCRIMYVVKKMPQIETFLNGACIVFLSQEFFGHALHLGHEKKKLCRKYGDHFLMLWCGALVYMHFILPYFGLAVKKVM